MPAPAFHLRTLGRLVLLAPDGTPEPSLSTRRRKLAVLAVLALAGRPLERDALVGLFWPEQEEEKARHSLSDTLSHLRRVLGRAAIETTGTSVALAPAAPLEVDAVRFAALCAEGRQGEAVDLYEGPFLGNATFPGASPRFEHWADGERARLERLFAAACEKECLALMRARAFERCAELAGRWLEATPFAEQAALYRLNALKAPGTPAALAAAVAEYERLARWLAAEHDTHPGAEVEALAERVREQLAALAPPLAPVASPAPEGSETEVAEGYGWTVPAAPAAPAPAAPPSAAPTPASAQASPPRRRARRAALWGALALVLAGAVGAWAAWRGGEEETRPIFALVGVRETSGDSASAWLAAGLTQMVFDKLARQPDVGVVTPERVSGVLRRAQLEAGALDAERVRAIGRAVGARWVVDGQLSRGDSAYVLEFAVREVADGDVVRTGTVSGADVLALADAVAARLLDVAGAAAPGPRLADVETANLEAYEHYVRARELLDAGRTGDAARALDAAIALDSGFVSALRERSRIAVNERDGAKVAALAALFARHADRATEWDRLELGMHTAFQRGEHARSEALGRALVARYPNDPRAHVLLRGVYMAHGKWDEAERTVLAQLALDSLATVAGRGACVPCNAYLALAEVRAVRGDLVGAARALRRLLALQPDLGTAWGQLALLAAYERRDAEARELARRALTLDPGNFSVRRIYADVLLMTGQYDTLDVLIGGWLPDTVPTVRPRRIAMDLQMMLARERGQWRRSIEAGRRLAGETPNARRLLPLVADGMARIGDREGARRLLEALYHADSLPPPPGAPLVTPLEGDRARDFVTYHATLAHLVAPGGDTALLRALADSIERIGARSWAGEDWGMHHHVRGLIAMHERRWAEAEREFALARWGVAEHPTSMALLAEAQLAQGRAADAIATLRDAYKSRPLFFARFMPRSELDWRMARAFVAAGQPDSARIYAERVRRAWRHADPEARALLAELP